MIINTTEVTNLNITTQLFAALAALADQGFMYGFSNTNCIKYLTIQREFKAL